MTCKKRSHLENCQRVCAVCWNKCSRCARPVEITLIKEFVIENYTSNSVYFPSGMCPSCSRKLYEYRRGYFRRTNSDCFCRIRELAKSHPHKRRDGKHWQTRLMGSGKPETFQVCSNCFAIIYVDGAPWHERAYARTNTPGQMFSIDWLKNLTTITTNSVTYLFRLIQLLSQNV